MEEQLTNENCGVLFDDIIILVSSYLSQGDVLGPLSIHARSLDLDIRCLMKIIDWSIGADVNISSCTVLRGTADIPIPIRSAEENHLSRSRLKLWDVDINIHLIGILVQHKRPQILELHCMDLQCNDAKCDEIMVLFYITFYYKHDKYTLQIFNVSFCEC